MNFAELFRFDGALLELPSFSKREKFYYYRYFAGFTMIYVMKGKIIKCRSIVTHGPNFKNIFCVKMAKDTIFYNLIDDTRVLELNFYLHRLTYKHIYLSIRREAPF